MNAPWRPMYEDRIRLARLRDKIMSAHDAATLFENGMTVGMIINMLSPSK